MSSTSSKIPIAVNTRGTVSNAILASNSQSPEHLYHHPHYNNHRSPTNRPSAQHSSSVPTTDGFDMRLTTQQKAPTASTSGNRPRFEAYMMTGDLIINLANTKSSDNIFFEPRFEDKLCYRTKRQRMTPNLHSTTLNVYKHETSEGSSSLPSSPGDPLKNESDNVISSDSPISENSPLKESQSQQQQQTYNVRLSKSEDHLVQGSLAVCGFNDIDNESVQSNSVDALLNNGANEEESSKQQSPTISSNNVTNTCSSSPSNDELTNASSATAVREDTRSGNRTSSIEDEDSSIFRMNSSSRGSSDTSSSYNATTTTATTPPDGAFSFNNSPTKAMSTATNTQAEQTESSMSEGYSVVSSLSGATGNNPLIHQQSHHQKQYHHTQNAHPNNVNHHHMNSLSLSSSCESSNCSSPSPLDVGEEEISALRVPCVSAVRQADRPVNTSSEQATRDVVLLQTAPDRREEQENQNSSIVDNSPIRYPSFIGTCKETAIDDSPDSSPPPLPNGPPPSTSSSENDSGSEDEIDALNAYHCSPPKAVDTASASRLAKRLFNLEGFKKSDVSRHLSKNNDFSRAVAEEYLKYFDFTGDTLDGALRKFLAQFCLIGETQERERVLVHFSKRYLDCNNGSFKSSDSVHTLTCALMLLNTDLHGENVGRRMASGEFIENLAGLDEGDNFPRDILRALFQSIKNQPLQWAVDDDLDSALNSDKRSPGNGSTSTTTLSHTVGHNPFLDVPNPNVATEYKKGYIMRKCCFDVNGKRTPLGKRGWKMFYATLRDMVLYLHKDEHGFRKNQLYESLHNSIRVHHSLASKATDYTKKQFVFRLQTADGAEYLFQTSDAHELHAWIEKINTVAASLSSPPLPSAVGSQTKKFQKPLLPVHHTKLSLRDQLLDHENRKLRLERELEEHLTNHLEKSASRRSLSDFAEKESYLQYEASVDHCIGFPKCLFEQLKKYQEYINLLRKRLQHIYETQGVDSIAKMATNSCKSKPLTTLSIGEELDDEEDEDGVPVIKRKSIR